MQATTVSIIKTCLRWGRKFGADVRHTFRSIMRAKVSYMFGFTSVLIVVVIVAVLGTFLLNTPLIILRRAEIESGEFDLVLSPGDWSGYKFLNYSTISRSLQFDNSLRHHSPRQRYNIEAAVSKRCAIDADEFDPMDRFWKYPNWANPGSPCFNSPSHISCMLQYCQSSYIASSTTLIVINSDMEKEMGLGRNWKMPKGNPGDIFILKSLALRENINQNDILYIKLFISEVLISAVENMSREDADQVGTLFVPFKVAGIFEFIDGKAENYLSEDGNSVMFTEYSEFLPWISQHINPSADATVAPFIRSNKMLDFASEIMLNLPPDRITPYMSTTYSLVQKRLVDFASRVMYIVGYNQVDSRMPILEAEYDKRFLTMFLGLTLNIITAVLLFLCVLLIYSLLMINVETRTFEMGVLRTIGMTKAGLVQLLFVHALSYSIPAWSIGLLLAQLITFILFTAIKKTLGGVYLNPSLNGDSILNATILGFGVPILASIVPIQRALSNEIVSSLEIRRSKTTTIKLSIERSEDKNVNWSSVVFGICLVFSGFLIYYLFPIAILNGDAGLLLDIFFGLLLGMLFGWVILALNFEHLMEHFLVHAIFWWELSAIRSIVLKNLVAHRFRNRKTAIMFSVSLAFIVFISVVAQLQMVTIANRELQNKGSKVGMISPDTSRSLNSIVFEVESFLKQLKLTNVVESFSWTSHGLNSVHSSRPGIFISNLGQTFKYRSYVYAVQPSFMSSVESDFLSIFDQFNSGTSLSEQLYSHRGQQSIIIGSLFSSLLGVDLGSPLVLQFDVGNSTTRHTLLAASFLDSCPGFHFSQFPQQQTQDALISFPTFLKLLNNGNSISDIPLRKLVIKLGSGANTIETDALVNQLRVFGRMADVSVFDYRMFEADISSIQDLTSVFFNLTTFVAMFICFFALNSSMYSNIIEQNLEIGILRSLGLKKIAVGRIYAYEAFILVVSSSLFGSLIGAMIGWTMTIQQSLYLDLPLPFAFPYMIILSVVVIAMILSVLSTIFPVRSMLKNNPATILRSFT